MLPGSVSALNGVVLTISPSIGKHIQSSGGARSTQYSTDPTVLTRLLDRIARFLQRAPSLWSSGIWMVGRCIICALQRMQARCNQQQQQRQWRFHTDMFQKGLMKCLSPSVSRFHLLKTRPRPAPLLLCSLKWCFCSQPAGRNSSNRARHSPTPSQGWQGERQTFSVLSFFFWFLKSRRVLQKSI